MKSTKLSNKSLLTKIKTYIREHKRVDHETLELLEQIDSRKIHIKLKYKTLVQFCVKELGLSDGQARSNVNILEHIKETPFIKKAIKNKSIALGPLKLFFALCDELELSLKEQLILFKRIEGKPLHLCKEIIAEFKNRKRDSLDSLKEVKNFEDAEVVTHLIEYEYAPTAYGENQKAKVRVYKGVNCYMCQSNIDVAPCYVGPNALNTNKIQSKKQFLCSKCRKLFSVKLAQ